MTRIFLDKLAINNIIGTNYTNIIHLHVVTFIRAKYKINSKQILYSYIMTYRLQFLFQYFTRIHFKQWFLNSDLK